MLDDDGLQRSGPQRLDAVTVRQEHEQILAALFEPLVAVACVDATELAPPTAFDGEAWLARATPARQREFYAGRACAARIRARLGLQPADVARGAAGEPVWPADMVGSISHVDGLCLAVGARASDIAAIGVDLDPDRPESEAFARRIGSEVELVAMRRIGAPIGALFAAKEASYKLQFPLTRDASAWGGIEVLLLAETAGTFTVRFAAAEGALASQVLQGRWRRARGFIWAGVAWRPS